jgi:hypothetical protein
MSSRAGAPAARATVAKLLAAACLLAAIAAAWQLLAPRPAFAASAAESWVTHDLSWGVLAVAPGERAVEVVFIDGGCPGRNLHASVTEARTSVTIAVVEEKNMAAGLVCPAIAMIGTRRVGLAAPLAGRLLEGGTSLAPPPSIAGPRVPRLTGFSPRDAQRALRAVQLRAHMLVRHGARGLPRVVAQDPAPGLRLPQGASVSVRVAER